MKELEWLKQWVEAQDNFSECLRPEDLEWCRAQRLQYLAGEPELKVVGDSNRFLAWNINAVEEDTQSSLSLLWGRAGTAGELRELFTRDCESPEVVSAFVHETEWRELLTDIGFYPLRHFVTKQMAEQSVEGPYVIRPATEADRSFFSALAVSVAVHTLPPGRKSELANYSRSLLKRFLRLDFGPSAEHRLLIAEEGAAKVGYLLLRTDDRNRAWVVDIGVDKSAWGRGVAQFLVLSAENQLLDEGYEFYVGEISAANSRSFYVSTELCGFSPNRELWRRDP